VAPIDETVRLYFHNEWRKLGASLAGKRKPLNVEFGYAISWIHSLVEYYFADR
jgi:hypothetical protein